MYLAGIDAVADDAIVDRYKSGFVTKFHRQAQCITQAFSVLLKKRVVTKDTRYLRYVFTDVVSQPPEKLIEMRCLWPFDFAGYTSAATTFEKRRLIATTLHEALVWSAGQLEISAEPFNAVYQEMHRHQFTLTGLTKSSWVSPTRQYRVRIFFTLDIDGAHLSAVLYKNRSKKEIGRIYLGVGPTGCLADYLSNGRWISDLIFELQSLDFTRMTWTADFSKLHAPNQRGENQRDGNH